MMRGTKRFRVAAAALLAALLACTACDGGSGDGAIPLDQLWNRWIEVRCGVVHRCPYFGVMIPPVYAGSSVAECVSALNTDLAMAGIEDPMWDLRDAVARGTVRYDGNAARTCFDRAAGMSCEQIDREPPAECELVFVGTVAPGGQCTEEEECLNGWCDTGSACPGRCVAYRRVGESCTGSGERCEPNTDCDDSGRCATEPPRQYAGEGQTCGGGIGHWCGYGLYCGEAGTCVRLPPIMSEGQTCGDWIGYCNPALACHEGTCRRLPATVGAECAEETLPCALARNLVCDPSTSRCIAIPGAGEPCLAGSYCGPGTFCGGDRTCRATLADGASCTDDDQCSSGNCTAAGACGPRDPCGDELPSI
ncbi:MAG: hypothetical protein QME96_10700 [Myxococcota bacterium]|nr:hypothetical protein [Myxococcota bacterium]